MLPCVGLADVTIESSSLKSFSIVAGGTGNKPSNLKISGEKLEDMHIRWRTNSSGQSWNIVAPNLTYLEWIGNTINHQLGKLLHLEKGKICLVADHNSFGKMFEVFRSIRREKVIATTLQPFSFGSILNILQFGVFFWSKFFLSWYAIELINLCILHFGLF